MYSPISAKEESSIMVRGLSYTQSPTFFGFAISSHFKVWLLLVLGSWPQKKSLIFFYLVIWGFFGEEGKASCNSLKSPEIVQLISSVLPILDNKLVFHPWSLVLILSFMKLKPLFLKFGLRGYPKYEPRSEDILMLRRFWTRLTQWGVVVLENQALDFSGLMVNPLSLEKEVRVSKMARMLPNLLYWREGYHQWRVSVRRG